MDIANEDKFVEEEVETLKEELEEEELELDQHDITYMLYGKRIKELIKEIGAKEGINVSFSKDGFLAIQEYFKLISAVFAYEMVGLLETKGRKRINREIVQQSVNSLLNQSDAINISVNELQKTIDNLIKHSKNSNIQRATDFVNDIQPKGLKKDE